MTSFSLNAYEKQEPTFSKWVWYDEDVALLEGQGVCYNWDKGTASSVDNRRYNYVELPTILNARYFAGVSARPYSANTGGQLIEIYAPGSTCSVLSMANTTIGVGLLTCEAGGTYAGYFRDRGFEGEGTVVPLQSVDRSETAGLCQAHLQTGPPSGLVENVVANADGLLDGGATTIMVGGVTYFDTDISTGDNATATLADGTTSGLRKAFVARETQTNDIVISPDSGIEGMANADPTDALATITLDADLEEVTLEWNAFDTNGVWVILHTVGAAIA